MGTTTPRAALSVRDHMERTGAMVNVNGVTMPVSQVSYMTSMDKTKFSFVKSSEPGSFQKPDSFDRNAVLKRVNFYRRVYNSPDAKWSKSKENLAQKATRYLCALGKLEHSVSAAIHHLFNLCFTSQGPATSCSLGYGYKSVNKMIENWCENGVDNWGSPTEAKIYCDRGYYNNPNAAQVRS